MIKFRTEHRNQPNERYNVGTETMHKVGVECQDIGERMLELLQEMDTQEIEQFEFVHEIVRYLAENVLTQAKDQWAVITCYFCPDDKRINFQNALSFFVDDMTPIFEKYFYFD